MAELTDEELQQVMAASPRALDATQLQPVIVPPVTQPDPSMPAIQSPAVPAQGQQSQQAPQQVAIVAPKATPAAAPTVAAVKLPDQPTETAPRPAAVAAPIAPGVPAAPPLAIAARSSAPTLAGTSPAALPSPAQRDPASAAFAISPRPVDAKSFQPVVLPPESAENDDSDPLEAKTARDQKRQAILQKSGSGISQIFRPVDEEGNPTGRHPGFWKKFGGVAARIGDIAGTAMFPTVMAQIPGTELHHRGLLLQQEDRVNQDFAQQKAQQDLDTDAQASELVDTTDRDGNPVKVPQSQLANYISKRDATAQKGDAAADRNKVAAAKAGFRIGADGKISAMDESELSAEQKADLTGKGIRDELRNAQRALADANAEVARQKVDPNSPYFKLALQRQATAQQNANAANTRASAYMGRYLQSAYNTGLNGEVLPGAPVISNDAGEQTVVGTGNASSATKAQSGAAQFNDVYGATDNIEKAARDLVAKNGKGALNDARVAAALADPTTTSKQWAQGMFANRGLSPEQRNYVIAAKAYPENLQSLRKSAGGGISDSQVNRLMELAPGAHTPDLDYLLRQTSQIRGLADRLGKGATVAQGGLSVQGQGKANQTQPTASRTARTGSRQGNTPPPRPAGAVAMQKFSDGKKYYVDGKGVRLGLAQ